MKAEDTTQIDLRGKTTIADTMVVTSGRSNRHVGSVADRVLEVHEEARVGARVRLVHEDAALPQQRLEALQDHVHGRIEQRVAGGDELGLRLTRDQRFFEGDAGVAAPARSFRQGVGKGGPAAAGDILVEAHAL